MHEVSVQRELEGAKFKFADVLALSHLVLQHVMPFSSELADRGPHLRPGGPRRSMVGAHLCVALVTAAFVRLDEPLLGAPQVLGPWLSGRLIFWEEPGPAHEQQLVHLTDVGLDRVVRHRALVSNHLLEADELVDDPVAARPLALSARWDEPYV